MFLWLYFLVVVQQIRSVLTCQDVVQLLVQQVGNKSQWRSLGLMSPSSLFPAFELSKTGRVRVSEIV